MDYTQSVPVPQLTLEQTDFKSFQKSNFSVRRRFTDFVFLRQTLHREYPACAVPPLPEKHTTAYIRGDRFSTEFTQRRAWSLHRFIKRLTLHPVLRRATILILFLETSDWNAQMRLRPNRSSTGDRSETATSPNTSGFFDNMADTMLNAFSKVHKPDKRFIEVTERSNKLDEDLSHVEKIIARVARREGDLEQDYMDLATNMRKLVPLEPGVEAPLQMFASCVEETSRGLKGLKDHTDQNYLGSLRDMEAYILSVKSLLKTREQKQLDFEGLTEYLQKASLERDTLASNNPYAHSMASNLNPATFIKNKMEDMRGIDHETAKADRLRKLELKIQELNREVESAKQTSEMFDEQVVREVGDFERIKGLEFRDSLGALAGKNVEFYKGTIATWERFLEDMEMETNPRPKDKGRVTA
jgi:sorting nexin-4